MCERCHSEIGRMDVDTSKLTTFCDVRLFSPFFFFAIVILILQVIGLILWLSFLIWDNYLPCGKRSIIIIWFLLLSQLATPVDMIQDSLSNSLPYDQNTVYSTCTHMLYFPLLLCLCVDVCLQWFKPIQPASCRTLYSWDIYPQLCVCVCLLNSTLLCSFLSLSSITARPP